ncbi:PfkB family carbohydrate kinase [Actinoalloteichus caeruleus]|uniref:PfkB family carbohydrate kinase n=1 Tax=Actinoalloteichus cyanogriseus TaxID=2893586 RepID=UPI003BB98C4D
MSDAVMIFAPSPQLTVTIEDRGGRPDIHLHPGGQGVWQARMLRSLDVPVRLVAGLGGEIGQVLASLISGEGIELTGERISSQNGGYVHDRRGGGRVEIVESPCDALGRHEVDRLYESAFTEGLRSRVAILSGPAGEHVLPTHVYRRLAANLSATGCQVLVDLAGPRLDASLEGGVDLLKISDQELVADGRATSLELGDIRRGMEGLRRAGADTVLVSRVGHPSLARVGQSWYEVAVPELDAADPRGAGDSMTAGLAAGIARGGSVMDAIALGAAAGAVNVTRRGLGTGSDEAILAVSDLVRIRPVEEAVT